MDGRPGEQPMAGQIGASMRIFFLSLPAAAGWGGSEELWADTARAALEDGHQVWITPRVDDSGNDARIQELQSRGACLVTRRQSPAENGKMQTEVVPNAASEIARTVDAIFLSAGGSVRELIDPAVRRMVEVSRTTKVTATVQLVSERDLLTDAEREHVSRLLRKISMLILPARRSGKVLERTLAMPVPRMAVVPSPIRPDLPGMLPWPTTTTARLACVARLNPAQKGQDLLLEVLSAARWRTRSWHLTFVGRGVAKGYLEDLVNHYKLTNHVTFAGFKDNLADVWAENQLLVLPSREESMPIAVLEAMHCARPCLVTDVGDNAEYVKDGVTGFLAPGDRLDALSHTLERAWRNRERWRNIGLYAYAAFARKQDRCPGRTALALLLLDR